MRTYTDEQAAELIATVRAARSSPRSPASSRIWFGVMVLSLLVFGVSIVLVSNATPTAAMSLWPWPLGAVLVFVCSYFGAVWTRRRFKRRVLAINGRICPNCHYPLDSLAEPAGQAFCPECREPYRPEDLRRIWSGWSPGMVWWE